MTKARVITRWENVDTGETGTFAKRNGRTIFKPDRPIVRARVYIGRHYGEDRYLYGCMIDGVFVDEVGGPCPHISLTSVELEDTVWNIWRCLVPLRTTDFLKIRRRPGRSMKSTICSACGR